MSTPRFLQPGGDGFYHCVSRIVDRRLVLGPAEKRHFVKWMRKLETFCGVEVVAYCMMSNHFHILVRVPDKAEEPRLTPKALRELIKVIYRDEARLSAEQELDRAVEAGGQALERLLDRYEARRHSLAAFMRELKQRFTRWFNRRHSRKGTLWEDRFRSVLVEGSSTALTAVAAYVDLNPVRAGIAEHPEDYAWSSYGEACGGGAKARRGLASVFGRGTRWGRFAEAYRLYLFETGAEAPGESQPGAREPGGAESAAAGRKGFSEKQVRAERRRGGKMPLEAALRCRTRHFTESGVLGTAEFVDSVFETFRDRFGPKRRSGARRLRGIEAGGLRCLRDLGPAPQEEDPRP